jgi:O-methyltransferase
LIAEADVSGPETAPGEESAARALARIRSADESEWSQFLPEARMVIAAWNASQQVPSYDADFLRTWNKSVDFLEDPRFMSAYRRGMDSGHVIGRPAGSKIDIHIEWRIHVCCWAAKHASHLAGSFVECGTNTGIMSLAACEYVDFNSLDKDFYLFDTFAGIPAEQVSEKEKALGRLNENTMYPDCWDIVRDNFRPYPRAKPVRGRVPEVLSKVDIDRVCYLCVDMNIAAPEVAAMEHFWDRLVQGAPVVFDDYGWLAYREQKEALDAFAKRHDTEILTLPTGQGLLIKP